MWVDKLLESIEKNAKSPHDKLVSAIEQNSDKIFITDNNGVIEYVNEALLSITGYEAHELIGKTPRIFRSGRHDEEFFKKMWMTILDGKPFRGQLVNKKKSGDFVYVDQTITPLKDEKEQVTHFVSIWKERSEMVVAEENLGILMSTLKIERKKLEQVLNMEKTLNTIKNIDKLIDYVVKATADILEVERCSLMFLDQDTERLCIKAHYGLDDEVIGKTRVRLGESIVGLVAQRGEPIMVNDINRDKRFIQKNKKYYRHKSFMSYPIKLDEALMGVINVSEKRSKTNHDFTELDFKIMSMIVFQVAATIGISKLYRELNYYNTQDSITNLFNYQHFTRTLDYELTRLKSFSGCLALIRIDIDNFRGVIKDLGQKKANQLLRRIGDAITRSLRDVDIACRYAGDEFIIILPEAGTETAKYIAHKIKKDITKINFVRPVTVSMGIAKYRENMDRYDLISKVTSALNIAKKKGYNQIHC